MRCAAIGCAHYAPNPNARGLCDACEAERVQFAVRAVAEDAEYQRMKKEESPKRFALAARLADEALKKWDSVNRR